MPRDEPTEVFDNERNFRAQQIDGKPKRRVEEIEVKVALVVKMVDLKALAERIEAEPRMNHSGDWGDGYSAGLEHAAELIREEFE